MNPAKKVKLARLKKENETVVDDILFIENKKRPVPVAEKNVIGFWHICMINEYQSIIKEQLDLLIKSALYQKADRIYVGCSGDTIQLEKVRLLFADHDKMKIFFVQDIMQYEFTTLKYLKSMADSAISFFTFYIHTKGVSYPGNEGGKHWRDYMNYYTITCWKDNFEKLKEGYDTCGVKLIQKGDFEMHYSGNFWWANSDYVKGLKPIDSLDKTNRFNAEMWICSNNPIAATLCQKFVDYNTRGKFFPKKRRILVHTLAYNLTSEVEEATKLLYQQNDKDNFEHVIVDLGFPIVEADKIPSSIDAAKLENAQLNIYTAMKYSSKFLSFANKGVSQNWEFVRQQLDVTDNDVLICCDPDERPKNNGWIKAVSDVLFNGNKIAWCSLMMKEHEQFISKLEKFNVGGYDVYFVEGRINWAQGGFSGKFLNEIKGIPVPEGAPIYGWIEDACVKKMQPLGYRVAILADYFVEHTECSPLYREWKTDVTTNYLQGQVTFDEWLLADKKVYIK